MNNLEQICCNLEWSKKLEEAGFPQDSIFYHIDFPKVKTLLMSKYDKEFPRISPDPFKKWYSSPTAEEILRELPDRLNRKNEFTIYELVRRKTVAKEYLCGYEETLVKDQFMFQPIKNDYKDCHALAEMYCYLAENKLLEGK